MLSVLEFRDFDGAEPAGRTLLDALKGRPGLRFAELARGIEEPGRWVLVSGWEGVGAYRRAFGHTEVKMAIGPLTFAISPVSGVYDVVAGATA